MEDEANYRLNFYKILFYRHKAKSCVRDEARIYFYLTSPILEHIKDSQYFVDVKLEDKVYKIVSLVCSEIHPDISLKFDGYVANMIINTFKYQRSKYDAVWINIILDRLGKHQINIPIYSSFHQINWISIFSGSINRSLMHFD